MQDNRPRKVRWLATMLGAGALMVATPAFGQSAEFPPEPPEPFHIDRPSSYQPPTVNANADAALDPVLVPSVTSILVGVIGLAGGIASFEAPAERSVCGLTDCLTQTERTSPRPVGVIVAASSMIIAGGTELSFALANRAKHPDSRRVMSGIGSTFLNLGVVGLGYGLGLLTADASGFEMSDPDAEAYPFIVAGGISTTAGLSFLVASATTKDKPTAARTPSREYRNEAAMGLGNALTILGATGLGGSVAYQLANQCRGGDFCGLAAAVNALTLFPGIAALGLGVPLWVTGGRISAPDIQVGAGSLSASWSLQ